MDMPCDGLAIWMGGVLLVTWLDPGWMTSLDDPRGPRILVSGMCTFLGVPWMAIHGLKLWTGVIRIVL